MVDPAVDDTDGIRTRIAASASEACTIAADLIVSTLRDALRSRGAASVAFSGGSTPGPMFDALVESRGDIDWSRIDVFQVDERIAPDGDPDRNANLLRARLVEPLRLPSRRVHLMPVTAEDVRRSAARYGRRIAERPLDVVHLGIGPDGHTASWPPGDPVIESSRPVDVSREYQGRRRMTLTPEPVNAATSRVVLVTESSKRDAVRRWLSGDESLPVSRVRGEGTVAVLTREVAP